MYYIGFVCLVFGIIVGTVGTYVYCDNRCQTCREFTDRFMDRFIHGGGL